MMTHSYQTTVTWTGNQSGEGTTAYTAYGRDFVATVMGKPEIAGSADPAFRGDATGWNPEELLLAALSACHKLWYLHLCAVNGIKVLTYVDEASAVMTEGNEKMPGHFVSARLSPRITISQDSDPNKAHALHDQAHEACFIANSVNFPVHCSPDISRADPASPPDKLPCRPRFGCLKGHATQPPPIPDQFDRLHEDEIAALFAGEKPEGQA